MADVPITGPASHFAAIEKTCGRPTAEWRGLVRQHHPAKHRELVAIPKENHGMGHGHANAIGAYTQGKDQR